MIETEPELTPEEKWDAWNLLDDPSFATVLSRCNAEYLYWDKVKYSAAPFNARMVWGALKLNRIMNTQPFAFGQYRFRVGVTAAMQAVLHHFDMQLSGVVTSDSVHYSADSQYYLVTSLMEEAIASSQMEGASTTRKVAKDMLRKQISPKNKSQRMIVNNYQTIRYLVEHKDEPLTPDSLRLVHQMITEGTLDDTDDELRFRTTDDIVVADGISGEIAHIPPKHYEIPPLVDALCAFFNADHTSGALEDFMHPVVKAIIIHFLVSWVHPFSDGNGRTARSLFYWFLLQKGYHFMEYLSISRIMYRSKRQYEKAFLYTEADDGDLGYFLHYNLTVLKKAADELRSYLERKSNERSSVSAYMQQGLNQRQAQFVVWLKRNADNVATVKEYETMYAVANQTARTDLYDLQQKGILKELALNKRKTGFVLAK